MEYGTFFGMDGIEYGMEDNMVRNGRKFELWNMEKSSSISFYYSPCILPAIYISVKNKITDICEIWKNRPQYHSITVPAFNPPYTFL